MTNGRSISVYTDRDTGEVHVRVDAPGERAVSAGIGDPQALIQELADQAGLNVSFNQPTE